MLIENLYNYKHKLVKTPLLLKSMYAFPAFVLSVFSNEIIFHISIFISFFVAIVYVTQQSIFKLLKLFLIPGTFILLGCLTLVLSFNIGGNINNLIYFDNDSFSVASSIFFRSFAIVSIVYFWLLTHTISEIAELMYKCKIPTLFIELFVLIYKFNYLLINTTKQMLVAQKCRMGYTSSRKISMNSFSYLFVAVFKQSMQQTEQLEMAMDSRLGNNKYLFVKQLQDFKISKIVMPLAVNLVIITIFIICVK